MPVAAPRRHTVHLARLPAVRNGIVAMDAVNGIQAQGFKSSCETYHNIDIFKMLVNKVPLSRIVDMLGISLTSAVPSNWLHSFPMHGVCWKSRKQTCHHGHWTAQYFHWPPGTCYQLTERKDKRNIVLSAITSVIQAITSLAFIQISDGSVDRDSIEAIGAKNGDADLAAPLVWHRTLLDTSTTPMQSIIRCSNCWALVT